MKFLAEVSLRQLDTMDWALEVCQKSLTRYDARGGSRILPLPSEPGPEPAAGAEDTTADAAETTRAAVEVAAESVKRSWQTKEFYVTLWKGKDDCICSTAEVQASASCSGATYKVGVQGL